MLYIIVVVYNKLVSDITSINLFIDSARQGKARVIIYDNSSNEYIEKNKDIVLELENIYYLTSGNNVGLSKAYNSAYNYILSHFSDNNFFVMLSDDDTFFSSEYLDNVLLACKKRKSVISGVIRTNGAAFSPLNSMSLIRKKYIDLPGNYHNIVCINSGLVLSNEIASKVFPINEKLFIDMIDYWIFYTLTSLNLNDVTVVSGKIEQSFSAQQDNKNSLRKRFKIYKHDCLEFKKIFPKTTLEIYFILLKRFVKIYCL